MPDITTVVNTSKSSILSNLDTASLFSDSTLAEAGTGLISGIANNLPASFQANAQSFANFSLGTVLQREGIVNGTTASIINSSINVFRDFQSGAEDVGAIKVGQKFIPIILETEFNILQKSTGTSDKFYVVFDSTPESIQFTKSAGWNPRDFLGRPEPVQVFNHSSAIEFSLTGMFFSITRDAHIQKIKLADYLLALTSPSKYHFMPSPVFVNIGQWKRLRCVVTNVSIAFKGPWWVGGTSANAIGGNVDTTALPLHAPYLYEATFNFRVVSDANKVNYAEDILSGSVNPTINKTTYNDTLNSFTEQNPLAIPGTKGNAYINQGVVVSVSDDGGAIKNAAIGSLTTSLTVAASGTLNTLFNKLF